MASPTGPTQNVKFRPKLDDMEQRLLYKLTAAITAGAGLGGSDFISDTSAHGAPAQGWVIIHALEDTVLAGVNYKEGTHTGDLAGKTLKAGDRIYGEFTAIQLTSGSVEAYRATI